MPKLALPRIEQRLRDHRPREADTQGVSRRAAVSVILTDRAGETQALFIRRAQRPGDLWSGHMAFPGGHWEPGDADLNATAVRETREEIGLDLDRYGRLLGHLDPMNINPIGRSDRMLIVPYVFAMDGEPPALAPNHEVADVLWGSVPAMFDGRSAVRRDMVVRGGRQPFPGYDVQGQTVWGLTYRMLHSLFQTLDPGWRGVPDAD